MSISPKVSPGQHLPYGVQDLDEASRKSGSPQFGSLCRRKTQDVRAQTEDGGHRSNGFERLEKAGVLRNRSNRV